MHTLLWVGLAVNAVANLRAQVLVVQDGEDRVKAGKATVTDVFAWRSGGFGWGSIILRTLLSPPVTVFMFGKHVLYPLAKWALFPRGITSKFAKQQAAAAAAAEKEREREAEAEVLRNWRPGEFLLAPQQPVALPVVTSPEPMEQVALGWQAAADVFDGWSAMVAETAGQPWSPRPVVKRIKAKVGALVPSKTYNEPDYDDYCEEIR